MAVTPKYLEGFDDGLVVDKLAGWSASVGKQSTNTTAVAGRTGSALQLLTLTGSGTDKQNAIEKSLLSEVGGGGRFLVGIAIRPSLGIPGTTQAPDRWNTVSLVGDSDALGIWLNGANAEIKSGQAQSAATIATITGVVSAGQWTYFEILIRPGAGGTGYIEVRVRGGVTASSACSFTCTSTLKIVLTSPQQDGNDNLANDFDDLEVSSCDADTDSIGSPRVYTLFPNGNGSVSQGMGSDANQVNNYDLVNEPTVSTTDYVSLNAAQRDLYTLDELAFLNGTVLAVQPKISAVRSEGGPISIRPVVKVGANESAFTATQPEFASVTHVSFPILETKPGGGAWTPADVNSAEFGAEAV